MKQKILEALYIQTPCLMAFWGGMLAGEKGYHWYTFLGFAIYMGACMVAAWRASA